MHSFWATGKGKGWAALSQLGKWYASITASSICAERAFALMRCMEDPHRSRMSEATFANELKARANEWLLASKAREGVVQLAREKLLGESYIASMAAYKCQ